MSGAARAVHRGRERSAIDVVWTGPPSQVTSSRLTSSVVIDLIDSARAEILLVSFANYPPAALREALERAVERGVFVTVLLERHEDIECGVLLRGREQPARIHAHIRSLLDSGSLVVA